MENLKKRISIIENDLAELEKNEQLINTVNEYSIINKKISKCRELLDSQVQLFTDIQHPKLNLPDVENAIIGLNIDLNLNIDKNMDDDELFNVYAKKMDQFKNLIETEDNLEELIKIYQDANFYSSWITTYLNKKKMTITNI
jgi:predicted component of type VI protein secretion system